MNEHCDDEAVETRFADSLDKAYDVLEEAAEEAGTQRENAALMLVKHTLDYARDVGLQREGPTPNQKLLAAAGGPDPEIPDDPGHWEEHVETTNWDAMVVNTRPERDAQ